MTVVIIQCRLSSTRLPGKALKDLGGGCTVEWTLSAMKKVKADRYFLACDYDSEKELRPLAEKNGFEVFAGDRDDVLKRFCDLIELTKADIVLRATADNPFLFYEAAGDLLKEFVSLPEYDYMTYTGLPHGSGVEVFNAHSLLKARSLTSLPYDHEHVGPALYNHPETFKSLFKKAEDRFHFPECRSTIDTYSDYKRAQAVCDFVSGGKKLLPYTTEETVRALKSPHIFRQILFVPSEKKCRGTGHLRRCLDLALSLKGFVYISPENTLSETDALVDEYMEKGLKEYQLVKDFSLSEMATHSCKWDLVVADLFSQSIEEAEILSLLGPVVSIDEGSPYHKASDFLLDIIPSGNLKRKPNLFNPSFIPLPENKRKTPVAEIGNALVVFGGEGHDDVLYKVSKTLLSLDVSVTAISGNPEKFLDSFSFSESEKNNLTVIPPCRNLKEKLHSFDLLVTHYGFTAFEAVSAEVPVLLYAISPLHKKLSEGYGFKCISEKDLTPSKIKALLEKPSCLSSDCFKGFLSKNPERLSDFIARLSGSMKISCPVCGNENVKNDDVVFRTETHTFRRCRNCSMIYLGFSSDSNVIYEKSYFDSEYKNQYGRTYLDDFQSIKAQGLRRMENINRICHGKKGDLLDVGCAYGPFLSAAKDFSWNVFGSDISQSAIDYVKNELHFNAVNASFTDFDCAKEFSVEKFDAVTMWYVIEHVRNLKDVISDINRKLKTGGIFAFSTPSGSGISRRHSTEQFFRQSPKDHYTIWEIENTKKILKRFGFKVEKIVSTGIHPERHPFIRKLGIRNDSIWFKIMAVLLKLFKAGDTYEVYCRKQKDIQEEI